MKKLALIVSNVRRDPQSRIVESMVKYSKTMGLILDVFSCHTVFNNTKEQNQAENSIYRLIQYDKYDGIVIFSNTIYPKHQYAVLKNWFKNKNLPIVVIGENPPDVTTVIIDAKKAISNIVEHFIVEHGFTRIAFASSALSTLESRDKFEGYRATLSKYNIPIVSEYVFIGKNGWHMAQEAVDSLINEGRPRPQAIVCAEDILAIGAITSLKLAGIKVPGDIAISGFNGIFDANNFVPKISTIEYPADEIARAVCEHIANNDKKNFKNEDYIIECPPPVFSESCGCDGNLGVTYKAFKQKYFEEKNADVKINMDSNKMALALTSVSSVEDLRIVLEKCVQEVGCDEFFLCLYENWNNEEINADIESLIIKGSFNEYSNAGDQVLVAYMDGAIIEDQQERDDLYKTVMEREVEGKLYTYLPVNYQEKMFGHILFRMRTTELKRSISNAWVMNLGIALESVCKQEVIDKMMARLGETYVQDALTGVYNRIGFYRYSQGWLEECKQNNKYFGILFLDLDNLKYVNDRYGHEEGDRFIKLISDILKDTFWGNGIIMRYGGDEFVVALKDCELQRIEEYIRILKTKMSACTEKYDLPYRISASIGFVNTCPSREKRIDDFISIADRKMYQNKKLYKSGSLEPM